MFLAADFATGVIHVKCPELIAFRHFSIITINLIAAGRGAGPSFPNRIPNPAAAPSCRKKRDKSGAPSRVRMKERPGQPPSWAGFLVSAMPDNDEFAEVTTEAFEGMLGPAVNIDGIERET